MTKLKSSSLFFLTILLLVNINSAYGSQHSPSDVIKMTVDKLFTNIQSNQLAKQKNPVAYREVVENVLEGVVDFETVTKFVMGKNYYLASSEVQRQRFEQVFKENLLSTFSDGLSLFNGEDIEILGAKFPSPNASIAGVSLLVKTVEGPVFPLSFTLKQDESGMWKIVNVILNGFNVGKAYKQRFQEAMPTYNNDIDKLIENWGLKASANNQASSEFSDSAFPGWKEIFFEGKTTYELKDECVMATSKAAASGLVSEKREKVDSTSVLKWAWKADDMLQGNTFSEKSKQGDDFLARVYVIHEGRFPWQTKALNYVWSRDQQVGEHWDNPFVGNAKMLVVQSGTEQLGEWNYFERNIKEDFKKYLDLDIDRIDAVALMTDTDNSGAKASACYQLPEIIGVKK